MKKIRERLIQETYIIGAILLLSLFSISLVSAAGEIVGFNYSNGSNLIIYGNYTTRFNLSVYSNVINTTGPYNITVYCNKSGGAINKVGGDSIKLITLSNKSAAGSTFETAYANISFLSSQGNESTTFNCGLYADNKTTQFWSQVNISSITFDSTPPNVSSTLVNIGNYGNYTGILILNITTNDATIGMDSVYFNLTYSNGSQVNYSVGTLYGGYYNITIDTTTYLDGSYNLTVQANDSLQNSNTSTKLIFTFDKTAPTVSLSCSPANVYSGETITCGCSGTDATGGVNLTSYTANPSTQDTGTHTTICTVQDQAGNSNSASFSYIVELGGTPGGGGLGGGSIITTWTKTIPVTSTELSSGATKDVAKKERLQLNVLNETHYVGVTNLTSTTATIEVSSTPQTLTMNIGDTKKFDINGDNFYDLGISLVSISNNKAKIIINSINEPIPTAQQGTGNNVTTPTSEKTPPQISSKTWLWVAIVVVILIILFILYKKKK